MKIEMRPLSEVHPSPDNPRRNEDAVPVVAESIRQFGFRNPIIVDADSVILAGHTRYAAAVKLRLDEVPVVRVDDLTPEQARMFRIADNQVAVHSAWDEELLFREVEALNAGGFDVNALGFSELELARMLAPEGTEGHTDPDAVPPQSDENPDSKPGTVYSLGRHRLYCGAVDTAPTSWLEGANIDVLLSDIGAACSSVVDALRAANEAMKPGAAFYLWYVDGLSRWLRKDCAAVRWEIRQGLIWPNAATESGPGEYACCHENCIYGWKDGAAHRWFSDRSQTTVLDQFQPRPDGRKPMALFAYLLGNSCPPGGTVLDVFAGDGTVAIAAERLGIRAFLAESSPVQCDVIRRRWVEFAHGEFVGCNLIENNTITSCSDNVL
jgi:site-specific DNA-methyltransferase (adenine-specific)